MPSIETPDPVHAVKSHHQARFDLIVPPPSAGSKMHSGDQQSPVAQEGESLAAELRRRASGHHKPYQEAEIGREELQGTRMRISFEQFGECRWFLLDEKSRNLGVGDTQVLVWCSILDQWWPFPLSLVLHAFHSTGARLSAAAPAAVAENDGMQPPLRQCQRNCLEACAKGARIIEMACGTGKTRVIQELVSNVSGRVPLGR